MAALPDPREDLALAVDAVRTAGAEVRARFGIRGEVRFKSADQPVTEADLVANEVLRTRLLAARPDYGWLSEETADSVDRLQRRRVWVVDPIDGTNSFVAGIPEFVVSVGLVEDGVAIGAAVYNPVTDELDEARRGEGARRSGVPIHVAPPPDDGEKPVLLASRWEVRAGRLAEYAEGWQLKEMGSTAYRMLKVADGSAHAFVSPAYKHEWDVCGAALVVEEAGGCVTRGDGSSLRYNLPNPRFAGIRVWNPLVELGPP